MINQDDLATALLAKIAATDLHSVDANTTQASSTGNANRLNPLSFIKKTAQTVMQEQQHQQALIAQLNKEAESAFPLPLPQVIPAEEALQPIQSKHTPTQHLESSIITSQVVDVLKEINQTLIDIKNELLSK